MNKFFVVITISLWFFISGYLPNPAYALVENTRFDRVIVKFHSPTTRQQKENLIKSFGFSKFENLKLADTLVLQVPKNRALEFVANLSKSPLVEYAEKDELAFTQEIPNDPYYPNQWGLNKIKAPGGWDVSHGSGTVKIAIADTGIDGTHPDLGAKIAAAVDCTRSCAAVSSTDGNGHGTHVAGIASAVTGNGQGVAGVGYNSNLYSVQVLDSGGSDYYSWIANGIIWATNNGADVINLSLGGTSSSSTLRNAVEYAWNRGVVVVAAAGNRNSSGALYPAYYQQAIAVGATTSTDTKASFSSYGSWVDVASPGLDIFSTFPGGRYIYMSGTSMSTPFVSGLAGLLFGFHPGWSNLQVRNQIEGTTDKISGTGTYWKYGRINPCKALDCAGSPVSPSPTPTPTPSPSPSLEPTPTPSPTPTPTPSPSPSPSPTPSPSPKPWWCKYLPSHYLCQ